MNIQSSSKKILYILCILTLVIGLSAPHPAKAGGADVIIIVDSSSEGVSAGAADGVCAVLGGEICTLREAIKEAQRNFSLGKSTLINFSIHDTNINLTLGALIIAGNFITVDGGANNIIINGAGNPPGTDIFNIQGNNNAVQNIAIHRSRQDGIRIGDPGVGGFGSDNVINHVFVTGSERTGIMVYTGQRNAITNSLIGSSAWANNICATHQGNAQDGVAIGGGSTYTVLQNDRIVCNGASGVYIYDNSTSNTTIQNCMIGTDGSSYVMGNGFAGVKDYQANSTTLDSNLISRNGWEGVWLQGSSNAVLIRNRIGTSAGGNTAMGNLYDGIHLSDNAASNTIGSSTDPALSNLISGNGGSGIALNSSAHNNLIDGNVIGIGANISSMVPNGLAGIAVLGGAHDNNIGSLTPGAMQLIAGNQREGIFIEGADANHVHASNFVGTLGLSFLPRGNGREGILVKNASNNLIEGYYVYNGLAGIAIEGDAAVSNLFVPTYVRDNGGLAVDLGNDGTTVNGSHGTSGPNHWLPYPVITGASGSTLSGTACNNCYVFVYVAMGDPAVNRGGGIKVGLEIADGSGVWTYTMPVGKKRTDYSLIACTGGLSGDCSEMSPRPVVYVPLARK